jgi:L-ascorbate metabolism protein UlaG (beta-lactamase superfamily)
MMDGVNVVHLGDLGHKLSENQIEKLGEVHLLLTPVGGKYTIDAEEAGELIKDIQPSLVVPMHYKIEGMGEGFDEVDGLEKFLEKNKLPLTGEAVHKVKLETSSLPDDTQVLLMNA